MSKPWDKLRVKAPTPIGPGVFGLDVGPNVEVLGFSSYIDGDDKVDLRFGELTRQQPVGFSAAGLRQLAEFCNELADQLESQ